MTVEENLKLVDEIERAINARDWDSFRRLHDPGVTAQGPTDPEPIQGIEPHAKGMEELLGAFPDMSFKVSRTFGQDEWVCVQYEAMGTHTGPLAAPDGSTIDATGKSFTLSGVTVLKIADQRILWERDYWDTTSLMSQLGLGPQE